MTKRVPLDDLIRIENDYRQQVALLLKRKDRAERMRAATDLLRNANARMSAPEPSVEQMIEEMQDVWVFHRNVYEYEWCAIRHRDEDDDDIEVHGDTPREAVMALYRATRERE